MTAAERINSIKGWRTYLLSVAALILYFMVVFGISDEAERVRALSHFPYVLAGLGALIYGGKWGQAQKIKAANGHGFGSL